MQAVHRFRFEHQVAQVVLQLEQLARDVEGKAWQAADGPLVGISRPGGRGPRIVGRIGKIGEPIVLGVRNIPQNAGNDFALRGRVNARPAVAPFVQSLPAFRTNQQPVGLVCLDGVAAEDEIGVAERTRDPFRVGIVQSS